jgi:hypothetical protein
MNEWRYSLPTPVPEGYQEVKPGSALNLEPFIRNKRNKPLFLIFFNPECPCSRFNLPHCESLIRQYGSAVNFAAVVMQDEEKFSPEEIQNKLGFPVPVYFDEQLAGVCGVYSTPQAVIVDTAGNLYYRGNFNKSRYCTDKNSYFARIALDSLLYKRDVPEFSQAALISYGCELPHCKKQRQ